MNAKTIFDRCIIINLDRRRDRRQECFAEIAKGWPFVDPQFSRAIDGQKVKPAEVYQLGAGVWACLQSHRRALEDALNDGCESLLVLEDDFTLCEGFADKAVQFMSDIPPDWEFAMFGGN